MEKKKFGSVKRFGTRYGRRIKDKLSKIEHARKGFHSCPYCNYVKVERVAAGIWFCTKCKAKFTGKAYSIRKKNLSVEETVVKIDEQVKP